MPARNENKSAKKTSRSRSRELAPVADVDAAAAGAVPDASVQEMMAKMMSTMQDMREENVQFKSQLLDAVEALKAQFTEMSSAWRT